MKLYQKLMYYKEETDLADKKAWIIDKFGGGTMKKKLTLFNGLLVLFALMFIASMIFYFHYNATSHKPRQIAHSYVAFNDWEVVHDDGTRESIMLPVTVDPLEDKRIVLEAVLPENLTEADWLNFSNGYDIDVYIDGVLRKSFRESDVDLPSGVVKRINMFCKLSPNDSGKVVRIERDLRAKVVPEMYIGDSLGLVSPRLYQGAALYVITIVLILMSLLVVIFGIVIRIIYKSENSLISLGFGVIIGSLWLIFDSPMYQFVFDNYYIDGNMSFIMSTLLAFPFLACVNTIENKRHNRINSVIGAVLLLNSMVVCGLHFSDTIDFEGTLLYSDIIIVLSLFGFLVPLVSDIRKKKIENKVQVYGLFVGLICGGIEAVLINMVENRMDGGFILLGLWIILLSALTQQIINIWKVEQERQGAIRATKAKSEFLAKMSHEIRTPINAILGMDEMILRECSDSSVTQYASDIKIASNNLLSIINEILDSSKIESGKMEIVPGNYKLAIMLNDLYNIILVKSEEKGLTLSFDIDESMPSEYFGDDVRIRQVLVNLLTNAVKYTEKGEVRLKLSVAKDDHEAILSYCVSDTGIGIKGKDIAALTMDYQRLDEKHNRYIEGTGLGMSITTQLLKLMGSELKVQSTYGKGSVFSFELRQEIVNEKPIGNFRENEERLVGADKPMDFTAADAKILVVDDNRMNRKVFSLLLKNVKMQITEADSGKACLEAITKEKYDIIFLDHMMPEMDGIEVLGRMKNMAANRNGSTPIIMFTANAINGAKEYYVENGALDYIAKPVKPDELEKIFMKYLDGSLIHRNS